MAKCKWCGKSGLFLSISKNGLCNICEIIVVSEVVQYQRLINESTVIIQQSSNTDTIVSRFDFIVDKLNSLSRFEKKEIPTIIPPPSIALETMSPVERDNNIVYGLEKELGKLKLALTGLKTNTAKMNRVNKFLVRCQDYAKQMINPTLLEKIQEEAEHLILD